MIQRWNGRKALITSTASIGYDRRRSDKGPMMEMAMEANAINVQAKAKAEENHRRKAKERDQWVVVTSAKAITMLETAR